MSLFDVSIIIVNWNTQDILRDCLRSVYEQTRDISFEVIVVDNASYDGSAEMACMEYLRFNSWTLHYFHQRFLLRSNTHASLPYVCHFRFDV